MDSDAEDAQQLAKPGDSSSDEAAASEEEQSADEEDEEEARSEEEAEGEEGGSGGEGDAPTQAQLERRRQANIRALVSGSGLALHRQALLPRLLTVQQAAAVLRRPFKSPHPNAPAMSEALRRKLATRNKAFVPWGGGTFVPLKLRVPPREPFLPGDDASLALASSAAPAQREPAVVLPPGVEPLVLWEPPAGAEGEAVRVDDMLTQFLRPHQREGVQFMFECVCGLRSYEGQGCILADDMGLGKTLQGISLLWTLLSSKGHPLLGGEPIARRVIICCPTSLVGNWDSECTKWLQGRVRTLPLCESSRDEALASISQFLSPRNPYQVMIVSYETFRVHAERFRGEGTCDLLICDEAHRLKNDATLTNRALGSLACRRRVLLSGTPLQNRLDEFYAMVSFCNPGVLGSPAQFRRHFEAPILAGREPGASEAEAELCQERTAELSALVNHFILRRTNTLLSQHLPPKVVEIVCCKLTPLQQALYIHFLESKATRTLFATQKAARVLSAITSLRKLLNHPKLIWDALQGSAARGEEASKEAEGFEGCAAFFPPGLFGGRGARGGGAPGWELQSGKFAVLAGMLELLRSCTRDRIVIVSNYTQTLDLVAQLCRDRGYPHVRLDGTTTIKKRNKLVKDFNDPAQNQFAFLLSSKAGGCGLNLIGGNRLVLFDPSWNPADDKQAAARVWRDGQQKKVYVYRFMAAGSIEEKVYQRQLSKEGLQQVVDSKAGGMSAGPNLMSMEELRDLFSYDPDTLSSTYDGMVVCQRTSTHVADKGGPAKTARGGGRQSSGQKRRRGAGRQPAAAKGRRRREWEDSSSGEEEMEEVESEEDDDSDFEEARPAARRGGRAGAGQRGQQQQQQQEEDVVVLDSDSEIVIPDSGDESDGAAWQGQAAAGSGRQPDAAAAVAAAHGRRGQVVEDSGSDDGWTSSEDEKEGSRGQQQEAGREQGPAQPLPPTQQVDGEEEGGAAQEAAAAGGEAGQGEQQQPEGQAGEGEAAGQAGEQKLLPSGEVKRQGGAIHKLQVGKPGEEHLKLWGHHSTTATVPDQVMQTLGDEHVSFVFSLEVDGKAVDPEPPLQPLKEQQQQKAGGLGGLGGLARRRTAAAGAGVAGPSGAPRLPPAASAATTAAAAGQAAKAAGCGAAQQPMQQQQQQQQQHPPVQPPAAGQPLSAARPGIPAAKENAAAGSNAAAPRPAGSKLALPARPKPAPALEAKRPASSGGLAAAVRRAVVCSDSDDDFQ